MTGREAAALLGISRKTLYRWHHEGRLRCYEWDTIDARRDALGKRARGPKRNPMSKRYHEGRHTFEKEATR